MDLLAMKLKAAKVALENVVDSLMNRTWQEHGLMLPCQSIIELGPDNKEVFLDILVTDGEIRKDYLVTFKFNELFIRYNWNTDEVTPGQGVNYTYYDEGIEMHHLKQATGLMMTYFSDANAEALANPWQVKSTVVTIN